MKSKRKKERKNKKRARKQNSDNIELYLNKLTSRLLNSQMCLFFVSK